MADEEKFDAVVIGAGPAGTAAAITMAKAGLQVALLERGVKPGSKNVMGGILYNHYLEEIVGDEWKQAPLERPIIEERRWMMTPEAAIGLDYKNLRNRAHPHSYSVLRAKFDAWFAEQAEKGGAIECFGDSTMGMSGFMFIYTNRDTLSVGGGALLSEFNKTLRTPNDLIEHFKQHPAVKPLLRGAETVEYLAHLIPEGGYRGIPRVYGPGYLVCGDAAMLSNPVHREGSNLAMESGRLAGETVIHAKEAGDFSERRLAEYRGRLDHSWIMADMKKSDKAATPTEPRFCASRAGGRRACSEIPTRACRAISARAT